MVAQIAQPEWSERSEIRLNKLVERARRKFQNLYPGQSFDAQIWNGEHLVGRPTAANGKRLGFITLQATSKTGTLSTDPADALPAYFADAVKSWIVCDSELSLSHQASRLLAARHFWNFLTTRQPHRQASFRWGALAESDLLAFELYLRTYRSPRGGNPYHPNTIRGLIDTWQLLADFLFGHGICRRIEYFPHTPKKRNETTRQIDARRKAAEEKIPAPGVLEALGEIYHRMVTAPKGEIAPWELILISAVAVAMLTGLRIGELVTLPEDCEVEEAVAGKIPGELGGYRYGIKYWIEKRGRKAQRIRWISPTAEPVVRAAIGRIRALTSEARARAKVLEANPGTVPLPAEYAGLTELTTPQVTAILGYRRGEMFQSRTRRAHIYERLPRTLRGNENYFAVKDVEAFLYSRRVPRLYTIRHSDGTFQMLSESLFVTFDNESRFRLTNARALLVRPLKASQLDRFMRCPARGESYRTAVFARYGTTEDQRLLSANSHSFRHWLHHIAYKGKMPVHLITRYFARANPRDTRDYLHFTPEETGAYVRAEIRAGRVFGPVAKTYWSLPPGEREDYLTGQVSVGHFTPWGLCTRNFTINPCDKHVNCLNDCGSFCSSKGSEEEITALLDLQAKTTELLRLAEEAQAAGAKWATAWVSFHRRTLTRISIVLFKHRDGTVEEGTAIRPFEGKTSLHLTAGD